MLFLAFPPFPTIFFNNLSLQGHIKTGLIIGKVLRLLWYMDDVSVWFQLITGHMRDQIAKLTKEVEDSKSDLKSKVTNEQNYLKINTLPNEKIYTGPNLKHLILQITKMNVTQEVNF